MVDTNLPVNEEGPRGAQSSLPTLETTGLPHTSIISYSASPSSRVNTITVFYTPSNSNEEYTSLIDWTDDYETALASAKRSLQHRLSRNPTGFTWRRWLETRVQTSSGDRWAEFIPETFSGVAQVLPVELRLCEGRESNIDVTVNPIGYTPTIADGGEYYQFKVIAVGPMSAGKSMMLQCFTTPEGERMRNLSSTTGPRMDTAVRYFSAQGKPIRVNLWDTAGQERFRSLTRSHYRDANGVLLVYDTTSQGSFNECSMWLNDIREEVKEQTPILLVGNQVDRVQERAVASVDARAFADQHKLLFIEISSTEGTNVDQAFKTLLHKIFNQLEDHGELETFKKTRPIPAPARRRNKCC